MNHAHFVKFAAPVAQRCSEEVHTFFFSSLERFTLTQACAHMPAMPWPRVLPFRLTTVNCPRKLQSSHQSTKQSTKQTPHGHPHQSHAGAPTRGNSSRSPSLPVQKGRMKWPWNLSLREKRGQGGRTMARHEAGVVAGFCFSVNGQ